MITWQDFADIDMGPRLPLLPAQKVQVPTRGILPSGESNYFDISQAHDQKGSGINLVFPKPPEFIVDQPNMTGIYKTYGADSDLVIEDVSGIFHADGV